TRPQRHRERGRVVARLRQCYQLALLLLLLGDRHQAIRAGVLGVARVERLAEVQHDDFRRLVLARLDVRERYVLDRRRRSWRWCWRRNWRWCGNASRLDLADHIV